MEYGLAAHPPAEFKSLKAHPPETEAEFKSFESGSPTANLKWVGEPD